MSEQPFKVNVPDADIELLHKKIDLTRLPDELEDAGWDYGAPLADVRRLLARWREGYDWRKAEAKINELPQFTRDIKIDGFATLNIHYVHQKSTVSNAVPLLFVHGWPGHFLEVERLLPFLTAPSAEYPSFHVVALSLPGFGFSEAPKEKGFSIPQYAAIAHKLMVSLGYNEYVAQGGDWGHLVCRELAATQGPKHVKAWHTNFPYMLPPTLTRAPWLYLWHLVTPYSATDRAGVARAHWFRSRSWGYYLQQSTKPQTISYSLADSPVGILAWLYEKLVLWTDDYRWDDDEILTWISVYWFSRAGPGASMRIYYECDRCWDELKYSSIPMGLSFFPKELTSLRRSWVRATGDVVFESVHETGGHFAAYEKPKELADDIRKMFARRGPAYGVVLGKNGYA